MKHSLLLLGGLLFLVSCSKPIQPEFQKFGEVLINATMPNTDIVLDFAADAMVYNPNSGSLQVQEMDVEVFINGQSIGKITEPLKATLEGGAASKVPVKFRQEVGDAFKGFKPSLQELAGTRTVTVKLAGEFKANKGVRIPVNHSVNYEIPVKVIMNYLLNNRN